MFNVLAASLRLVFYKKDNTAGRGTFHANAKRLLRVKMASHFNVASM